MKKSYTEHFEKIWYLPYLICPDCKNDFSLTPDSLYCPVCGFAQSLFSPIDLRPINPVSSNLKLTKILKTHPENLLKNICTNRPEITYRGPLTPRNSDELMSEISKSLETNAIVLDVGCGAKEQAIPVRYLGYKYVGFDYSNTLADFLADAHSIPFKSDTFNCVLSYAVLEHLHNPFIAIQEIQRVLKPGGIFIGTVSQGEPFHASYFHHTPWGIISLVTPATSFEIKRLWSSSDTLESLARMGRYPKIIKIMLHVIAKLHKNIPCMAPHKMRWAQKQKELDKLYRTSSICFIMQKRNDFISD